MRNNIDATIFLGNALTIRVLIEIFSSVNQTKKTEIQTIYDCYGFGQKRSIFIAIKFELSLVITFMAFYDCVRTLCYKLYIKIKCIQETCHL